MSRLLLGIWPLGYFSHFEGILLNSKALIWPLFLIKNRSCFWTGTRDNNWKSMNACYFGDLQSGFCGIGDDGNDTHVETFHPPSF